MISPQKNENWWYLPVLKRLYITRGYSGYYVWKHNCDVLSSWEFPVETSGRSAQGKGLDDPLRRFTKRTVRHGPSGSCSTGIPTLGTAKINGHHDLDDFSMGYFHDLGKIVKFTLNLEDTAILGILFGTVRDDLRCDLISFSVTGMMISEGNHPQMAVSFI